MSDFSNFFYSYNSYLRNKFKQKTFKAGLSTNIQCPMKTKGKSCIFCNSSTFTDTHQNLKTGISEQITHIQQKIKSKCGNVGLIAYFHDNTATHGNFEYLKQLFTESLSYESIMGLVVSTRPDCIDVNMIKWFESLDKPVTVELGIQTIHDRSLNFLKRGHTQKVNEEAINILSEYDIDIGLHLILGIPGESCSDIYETINFVSGFKKIKYLKFHNLIGYQNTLLGYLMVKNMVKIPFNNNISLYYKLLGNILTLVPGDIAIGRLFTSNLNRTNIALNGFPGLKKNWLNNFYCFLKQNNIVQGSKTEYPYTKGCINYA